MWFLKSLIVTAHVQQDSHVHFRRLVFACGRETVRAFYTFLNLHTCSMLRNIWACTHVRCYATSGLAHMFDATQHLGLHTCSMLRNIWACTHVQCYATSGLAHMFDATQHLGLHTWLLLRNTMGWGVGQVSSYRA